VDAAVFVLPPEVDVEGIKKSVRGRDSGLLVQAFGTGTIGCRKLALMLSAQTIEAAKSSTMMAKRPEFDLLLRVAGTDQIGRAVSDVGFKKGARALLVVAGEPGKVKRAAKALARGYEALPDGDLSEEDFSRIEKAAVLGAARY
jgi:tRNA threonylcarbamoyladenosine modification (KEOPS) complex Cgi121 subunit